MKILIYGINYAPELTGIGKYTSEMCEWMAVHGHEVRVVCAPPYYPEWEVAKPYSALRYSYEEIKGVQVFRTPLWVPKKISGVRRVLHLLSFSLTSLPVVLSQAFWRPDIVMTIAPALTCAPGGWLTARLCGARAWLHVQDFEVDVAFNMGMLKGGMLKTAVLAMERFLFRRFDCVSTISQRMVDMLHKKRVDADRIQYFQNWVNVHHLKRQSEQNSYRNELGITENTRVVLFSGTLNSKQGLDVIPRIARRMQDELHRSDILFVIGGEGKLKPELEQASVGLDNIRFFPLQPMERLSDWLGLAHVHLLPQNTEAEDLVLPSKLSGMLASGRPVVAVTKSGTEIARVVSGCGLVVAPDDEEALIEAITSLVDNETEHDRLGRAARDYAEVHLSIEHILSNVVGKMGSMSQPMVPVSSAGKL